MMLRTYPTALDHLPKAPTLGSSYAGPHRINSPYAGLVASSSHTPVSSIIEQRVPIVPSQPFAQISRVPGYPHCGSQTGDDDFIKTEHEFEVDGLNWFAAFLKCEAFFKYRQGGKKESISSNKKWPLFLEWAFFQALARIAPCGRAQKGEARIMQGKTLGRNERIEHYMWRIFGIERDRKQVSSHLQVLRNYVIVDRPILFGFLISKDELSEFNKKRRDKGLPAGIISEEDVGYHMLPPIFSSAMPYFQPNDSTTYEWSLSSFEMALQPVNRLMHPGATPLHIYTEYQGGGREMDVHLRKLQDFAQLFPEINLHDASHPLDGYIMSAKAEISLPQPLESSEPSEFPEISFPKPAEPSQLCLYFSLRHQRITGTPITSLRTTFYSAGNVVDSQRRCISEPESFKMVGENICDFSIPFSSELWAKILSRLGAVHEKVIADSKTEVNPIARKENKQLKAIKKEFSDLVAVQQITIYSAEEPTDRHHLTIHWRFKFTETTSGSVFWNLIHLPRADSALPSPTETDANPMSRVSAEFTVDELDEPHTPEAGSDLMQRLLKSPIAFKEQQLHAPEPSWQTRIKEMALETQQSWAAKLEEHTQSFDDFGEYGNLSFPSHFSGPMTGGEHHGAAMPGAAALGAIESATYDHFADDYGQAHNNVAQQHQPQHFEDLQGQAHGVAPVYDLAAHHMPMPLAMDPSLESNHSYNGPHHQQHHPHHHQQQQHAGAGARHEAAGYR